MNTVPHPVVPERIMALLDGELPAAEARVVATHVDTCAECAHLAERLRGTSHQLSAWKVPDIPAKVEKSVVGLIDGAGSNLKTDRPALPMGLTRWTWGWRAILWGGTMLAVVLALTVILPLWQRPRQATMFREKAYNGRLSQLPVPPPHSEARSQALPLNSRVTLTSPAVAADSNGLYHGLGDHAEDSFSLDGQALTDQQSKIFASGIPAPMIARTVSLAIVVKDFAASRSSLDAILARHHGYSAQLDVSTPENAPRSLHASLRIPALELSSAVGDLKALGRVENESQTGENVTRQHVDLAIRLKNARETEQRFRSILQQHTGNVVEVLQVEEGIARVRGDIERMEAEQTTLEHRVDFGSIDLQLTEEYKAQLNPPGASVSTRLHNAFVAGYQNAAETVLGIVLSLEQYGPSVLIWLLILVLPAGLVARRYLRKVAAL
jgi:hypothetical protein